MNAATVVDATCSGVMGWLDEAPGRIMFGFRTTASSATSKSASSANRPSSTDPVTAAQRSAGWPPSISTSGSTIGTSPVSWHSDA